MKQGWEIKKLGEISLKISAGGDKPKLFSETITDTCNIPVYANGVINNGLCGYTDKAIIYDKCITISARGTIGFCCIRTEPFVPIVRLIVIVPKDVVSCEYLCYAVKKLKIQNNGGTIPQLTVPMLKEYIIPVPPREEQERIVGELDCLSGIIAAKRAQLRELDTLAQSIFYTMFGDPISNDKGWQTKALGDVARIINGYAFDSKLFSTDKNDMPLIRIRDIKKGYTETFYKGKYPNTYIIKNGDYIIGMDGEFNIVEWRGGTALLNQRVCKIEFIDDEVIGRYALRFLSIELKRIEDATSFVTVKHLSSKSLISIFIPIPPIDLQKQFAEKIENIERQKELITKSIKETEDLFNSRMSYYFD